MGALAATRPVPQTPVPKSCTTHPLPVTPIPHPAPHCCGTPPGALRRGGADGPAGGAGGLRGDAGAAGRTLVLGLRASCSRSARKVDSDGRPDPAGGRATINALDAARRVRAESSRREAGLSRPPPAVWPRELVTARKPHPTPLPRVRRHGLLLACVDRRAGVGACCDFDIFLGRPRVSVRWPATCCR